MQSLRLFCVIFWSCNVMSQQALPEDFVDAQPRVKLYMAYAEFKMANYKLARKMWLQIDGHGKAEAAFNLGILYEQGKGVNRNLAKARDFYIASAEAGSRAGAYQVGLLHLNYPELVDAKTALHWLAIAALDGDTDAQALLSQIQGDTDASWLISIRRLIAAGDAQAALAKLNSLASGESPDFTAMTELAWLYETGLAVEQDIDKAAQLFETAAKGGNAKAQYALAVMYQTGVGKLVNPDKADYWLTMSANQRYQPAQMLLSQIK